MDTTHSYAYIDAGNGRKLERFGRYILDRPCAQAVWRPALSQHRWQELADGFFTREQGNRWQFRHPEMAAGWQCTLNDIAFHVKPTDFGHIGIFPEHSFGWGKCTAAIHEELNRRGQEGFAVLNLFAYSGGATLAAAMAGASVCHLDASKKMVEWARENARLNHLEEAPIRWIVDDVMKFLQREIRRGRKYDAIILDPPSFGRGTNQELFQIDSSMLNLLELCRQVLSDHPAFVLLTCHTPGYTPIVLEHLMTQCFPAGHCTGGEMTLPMGAESTLSVPSGNYLWYSTN